MSGIISALSHSGKAVARKAQAVQETRKRSSFLLKNEQLEVGAQHEGISLFSNSEISPYNGSRFEVTILT